MPNAMKKFLTAGMLMIIVLTGTVFPLGVNNTQAKDIHTNFNIDTDKSPWVLKDFYVEKSGKTQTPVQATAALLSISFKFKANDVPFAKDEGSQRNVLDDGDDVGGWKGVVDKTADYPEKKFGNGIYLILDKVKDPNQPINSDNLDPATYKVPIPKTILQDYYVEEYKNEDYLRQDQGFWSIFGQKPGNDTNLGLYIWGLKDANGDNPFFKKQTWGSKNGGSEISIPVINLEKGTTYLAYIKISENNSGDYAVSNYLKFATPAEDPADPEDLEGLAAGDDTITAEDQSRADELLFDCDLQFFGNGGDSLGKCVAKIYYRWTTAVSTKILNVAGNIFDAFLAISIGSSIYNTDKAQFVYQGWRISRDIANIFFIFVLLFTAIGTILGLHSVNYKKVVTQVILVAIFINFSLFMCRVIIDTGNILARVFYNQIALTGATDAGTTNGDIEEKDISQGIANGVNPQKLFLSTKDQVDNTGAWELVLLGTVVAAFQSIMAWVLFMCAAFFVGRIGVLWLSMVFAPLAFVSTLVPSLGKEMKQIGWSGWFSSLTSASFYAPLFMFFLYLILLLTKAGLESIIPMKDSANGVVETITVVALPLMIIMGLLMNAKEVAKKMAGQFGDIADGAFKGAIGLGAMAVTGGAAAIGAKTLGANAMRTLNNQGLKNVAAGNMDGARAHGFTGTTSEEFERWKSTQAGADFKKKSEDAQKKLLSAKKMSERSFDLRQTGFGNVLSKATGVNMNTGSGVAKMAGLEFSSGARAGGARAETDRRIAKDDQKKKDMEEVLKGDPIEIHHKKEQKEELEGEKKKTEEAKTEVEERNKPLVEAAEKAEKDANFAVQQEKDRSGSVSQATLDRQRVAKQGADDARSVQTAELKPFNEKIKAIEKGGTYTENGQQFTVDFNNSIKGLEKDINYAEKGRAREYFKNKANDAHHTRDTYGNALSMNSLGATLKGALRDGLIGFAVGGPLGALAGSVVGASRENGAVLNRLIGVFENNNRTLLGLGHTNFSGRAQSYEEDQLKSDPHYHAKSFKDSYKSPNKDFFKMFEGLGGGGGHGGGGHDDHGHGGHDDHGGGDHGGGHH